MKRATPSPIAFVALLTVAVTSCRTPAPFEPGSLAEILVSPNVGLQLETREEVDSPAGVKYPLVYVKANIISGDMKILEDLGLSTAPLQSLSIESERALLKAAAKEERIKTLLVEERINFKRLAVPTLLVNSGQKSHKLTVAKFAYIKDLEFAPAKDGSEKQTLKPVIGVLSLGFAFELEPTIETGSPDGAEITIRDPRLDLVLQLGSRHCRTQIGSVVGSSFFWEEPVLLVGELHEKIPEMIMVDEGEAMLMRMQFRVEQGCANARALARGNRVEETYRPNKGFFAPGERSPLNNDYVVLINCEIIETEEELREIKSGDKNEKSVAFATNLQ